MTAEHPKPLVDGVDIDAVHSALLSTPGVSRVGSGLPGAMTTYLPGRRIAGIRISPAAVEVEVVAEWGPPLEDIARAIRQRLGGLVDGRSVSVAVTDIDVPGIDQPHDPPPDPHTDAAASPVASAESEQL